VRAQDDSGTLALIKRKPKVKFPGARWTKISKVSQGQGSGFSLSRVERV
jgi:hypothetical protein